ncbi:MAG: ATP citrate lyase citrate-binding domain-containing protein, partial [Nanoarchaeota archaeon]
MARVKIREFDAKRLLLGDLKQEYKGILIDSSTNLEALPQQYTWLTKEKLAIKPDQLFGKRGKLGLVLLDADFNQVKEYLKEHLDKEITIGKVTDKLTHFLIEPYVKHQKEYYLSITSERDFDNIFFSAVGGMNVEENWKYVVTYAVPTLNDCDEFGVRGIFSMLEEIHNIKIPEEDREIITAFIKRIHTVFRKNHFSYLEFNPFVINQNGNMVLIDTVAQVDSCGITLPFPKPFGRKSYPEEEYIASLDKESGASLKLTILNPQGRIWNILSGGGASIIYLDTV